MPNNFHIARSQTGYRVELYRSGKPYVTFVDGVSKRVAEQEARSLNMMWRRIRGDVLSARAVAEKIERTEQDALSHR